jgi:hypothetical protein
LKLRQAVDDLDYKTARKILNEDKEWISCDNETKKQLLTFYDDAGRPYIYRPVYVQPQLLHVNQNNHWLPSTDVLQCLLELGMPQLPPPSKSAVDCYDSLWHMALECASDAPELTTFVVFNKLSTHHYHDTISWSRNGGMSLFDEAISLRVNDIFIETLILNGNIFLMLRLHRSYHLLLFLIEWVS